MQIFLFCSQWGSKNEFPKSLLQIFPIKLFSPVIQKHFTLTHIPPLRAPQNKGSSERAAVQGRETWRIKVVSVGWCVCSLLGTDLRFLVQHFPLKLFPSKPSHDLDPPTSFPSCLFPFPLGPLPLVPCPTFFTTTASFGSKGNPLWQSTSSERKKQKENQDTSGKEN